MNTKSCFNSKLSYFSERSCDTRVTGHETDVTGFPVWDMFVYFFDSSSSSPTFFSTIHPIPLQSYLSLPSPYLLVCHQLRILISPKMAVRRSARIRERQSSAEVTLSRFCPATPVPFQGMLHLG